MKGSPMLGTRTNSTQAWTPRLEEFVAVQDRDTAQDLAADLSTLREDLEDVIDGIVEISGAIVTWTDDDSTVDTVNEAKGLAEVWARILEQRIRTLAFKLCPSQLPTLSTLTNIGPDILPDPDQEQDPSEPDGGVDSQTHSS